MFFKRFTFMAHNRKSPVVNHWKVIKFIFHYLYWAMRLHMILTDNDKINHDSIIWLDVVDVMTSLRLFRCLQKNRVNGLLLQFYRLHKSFRRGFDWNDCNYKYWTLFFLCLLKCLLHFVTSKVDINPFGFL